MARKKATTSGSEAARSQIVAIAERLAEHNVKKVGIVYITEDNSVGLTSTEEISTIELVFALRQAEHYIFQNDLDEEEDEDLDD
jgi:hypothetical protein